MRTEKKKRMEELREGLSVDERALLLLRVTRKLNWKEIARVMTDQPGGRKPTERKLDQWGTRFRQRFQVVNEKLRRMAREAGLVLVGRDER